MESSSNNQPYLPSNNVSVQSIAMQHNLLLQEAQIGRFRIQSTQSALGVGTVQR
jgi:hypothetical protein